MSVSWVRHPTVSCSPHLGQLSLSMMLSSSVQRESLKSLYLKAVFTFKEVLPKAYTVVHFITALSVVTEPDGYSPFSSP